MKKRIIIIFLVSIFLLSIGGVTLAYYTTTGTNLSITTPRKDAIDVKYETTNKLNITSGMPISSSDINTHAFLNEFTITPNPQMTYNIGYTIYLNNISLDNALKNSSFKWQLASSEEIVASGNFAFLNSDSLEIYHTQDMNSTTYYLRIWLEDNLSNQNDLMNKSFSCNIFIKTYIIS